MQWNDDRWAQLAGLTSEGGSGLLSEQKQGTEDVNETDLFFETDDDMDEQDTAPVGDMTLADAGTTTKAEDPPKPPVNTVVAGHKRLKKESRRQQRLMENKLRKLIREEIKSYMRANSGKNVQRFVERSRRPGTTPWNFWLLIWSGPRPKPRLPSPPNRSHPRVSWAWVQNLISNSCKKPAGVI